MPKISATLEWLEEDCLTKISELDGCGEAKIKSIINSLNMPDNTALPSNADTPNLFELFDLNQLAGLGILHTSIQRIDNCHSRHAMLLAFSATLSKINRTFLSAEGRAESRGGSSIFSIYRYKIAKKPVILPLWQTFKERALNVINAKQELDKIIELKRSTTGWSGKFRSYRQDVLSLSTELNTKVDYIFTDPPYGGHIAYLDLSTMWNAWLGILPSSAVKEKEIIVGGELAHLEETYVARLAESIATSTKMLKKNRWMSVVFPTLEH